MVDVIFQKKCSYLFRRWKCNVFTEGNIVVFGKACAENISLLSKPGDPIDKYERLFSIKR